MENLTISRVPESPTQGRNRLLVRPEEGANLASVSRSQFYKLLATNQIRSIKVGRLRRIPVSEIEAWVARQLEEQLA